MCVFIKQINIQGYGQKGKRVGYGKENTKKKKQKQNKLKSNCRVKARRTEGEKDRQTVRQTE